MNADNLKKTPLYSRHLQLGARMVPFAGYSMPVQYTGLLEETKATRKMAGLFDVSHMGQFWVRGKSALAELQKVTTNDLSRLAVGQAQYNMLCNEKGGVIDDIVIYRRMDSDYFICVNAGNIVTDWNWLHSNLKGVSLSNVSEETALIAIQGPQAESIVCGVLNQTINLKYYWAVETTFMGHPIYLSRTGYTGEDGFEVYTATNIAGNLWDQLLERGGELKACGLGARDTLRTEMGYPLHGHELSSEITPLEAGLGWVVKFTKSFIGDAALKSQAQNGPPKILRGLLVNDRRIPRPGYRIVDQEKIIGSISSGTFSPHLNAPIALGFVNSEYAKNTSLSIQIRETPYEAQVAPLPFVKSHTVKKAEIAPNLDV